MTRFGSWRRVQDGHLGQAIFEKAAEQKQAFPKGPRAVFKKVPEKSRNGFRKNAEQFSEDATAILTKQSEAFVALRRAVGAPPRLARAGALVGCM